MSKKERAMQPFSKKSTEAVRVLLDEYEQLLSDKAPSTRVISLGWLSLSHKPHFVLYSLIGEEKELRAGSFCLPQAEEHARSFQSQELMGLGSRTDLSTATPSNRGPASDRRVGDVPSRFEFWRGSSSPSRRLPPFQAPPRLE